MGRVQAKEWTSSSSFPNRWSSIASCSTRRLRVPHSEPRFDPICKVFFWERHKTATGLANTEPGQPGSRHKDAQRLQWFLSESTWDPEGLNDLRLAMLRTLTSTALSDMDSG